MPTDTVDKTKPEQSPLVAASILSSSPMPGVHQLDRGLVKPSSKAKANALLRRAVERAGVLVPILVCEAGDGTYVVLDGNRRRDASKADTLPCRIVGDRPDSPAVLATAVMLNGTDSPNVAHETEMLAELRQKGASEAELAEITCLKVATVRERLKTWDGLWEGLRNAFVNGEILASVAKAASRLSHASQEKLYKLLNEKGKLTAGDVDAERRVARNDELDAIPLDMPGLDEEPTPRQRAYRHASGLVAALEAMTEEGDDPGFGSVQILKALRAWIKRGEGKDDAGPAKNQPDGVAEPEDGGDDGDE